MSFYGLEVIQASHVLAMASLGISKVLVARPVRVRILSTGSELASHDSNFMEPNRIMDSNGTFITVVLSMIVIDTRFVRVIGDDRRQISNIVRGCCHCENLDVLITTGAVSAGKFYHVQAAIEDIGAEIQSISWQSGRGIQPYSPPLDGMLVTTGKKISTVIVSHPGKRLYLGFPEILSRQLPA